MTAKKINIGQGYSIRFDQRARGQETPYWEGTIFKDGKQVSTFQNGGTGGPTIISDADVRADFEKMVDEHCAALKITDFCQIEREAIIIEVAELLGYHRGSKQFADYPQLFIRANIQHAHEQMKNFMGE